MIVLWPSALRIKLFKWRPVYSWDGQMWWHVPPYPKVTAYVITDGAGTKDMLFSRSTKPTTPAGWSVIGILGHIKSNRPF